MRNRTTLEPVEDYARRVGWVEILPLDLAEACVRLGRMIACGGVTMEEALANMRVVLGIEWEKGPSTMFGFPKG